MGFKDKKNAAKKGAAKKDATPKKETKQDRTFVGGGWDNTNDYGVFLNLQLNKDKIGEMPEDEYGNIRLTVAARKEQDEKSGQDIMAYYKNEA